MERDLTTGSVFKTVIYFSLPYLLSYFLQTLYGMADLFIIGQFEGGRQYYCCLDRQPGYAYDHCYDRRPCHGVLRLPLHRQSVPGTKKVLPGRLETRLLCLWLLLLG